MKGKYHHLYPVFFAFALCGTLGCSDDTSDVKSIQVDVPTDSGEPHGFVCGNNLVECDGVCVHVEDDIDNCGACGHKCPDGPEGDVTQWTCRQNACVAEACREHYHVQDGACVEDDAPLCGGIDCNTLPGWEVGHCNEDGVCVAESCLPGYQLTTGDIPVCEEYIQDCDGDASTCELLAGAIEMACIEGKCTVSECDVSNYHWDAEHILCVENSIKECGASFVDCTNYAGWNPEDTANQCGMNADGVVSCIAASCLSGYHVYGGPNAPCEQDDHENCGAHGHACTENQVCDEGVCTGECVEGDLCGDVCVNLSNDMSHCGACYHDCSAEIPVGATALVCDKGACKVVSCLTGYHVQDGKCEIDTDVNCGGVDCTAIANGTAMCSSGKCVIKSCHTGYHVYNNTCEADTNNNCGMHDKICASAMKCINGTCACSSGMNCGSNCVDINTDNNNCGGCGKVCTGDRSCVGGICQCPAGKQFCNGVCVDIIHDSSNCGTCNHKCGTQMYCSGGSCRCNSGIECGSTCCNSSQYCSGGKCYDITPICPKGYTGSMCDQCDTGYVGCGYYEGKPLCLDLNAPSGKVGIVSAYCADYCNHNSGWGGSSNNYYVTRCQAGQKCYLNSYNKGEYVQCSW